MGRSDSPGDRRLLVTGASSGIGLATVRRLVATGASIVAVARNEERLKESIEQLGSRSCECHAVDVGREDDVRSLFHEIGPVDGVVHSAGIRVTMPLRGLNAKTLENQLNAELHGTLWLLKSLSRRKNRASEDVRFVVVSSVAASRGDKGLSAYSAAKAAIAGIVRSSAVELAPSVKVNSVVAGLVRTPMFEGIARTSSDFERSVESEYPLGIGDPDDVAAVILFLLSADARWVTGSSMVVDGGYSAG